MFHSNIAEGKKDPKVECSWQSIRLDEYKQAKNKLSSVKKYWKLKVNVEKSFCRAVAEHGKLLPSCQLSPTNGQQALHCQHQQKRQHQQVLDWHLQQPKSHHSSLQSITSLFKWVTDKGRRWSYIPQIGRRHLLEHFAESGTLRSWPPWRACPTPPCCTFSY